MKLAVQTVLWSLAVFALGRPVVATLIGPCVCGTGGGCDNVTFEVDDAPLYGQKKITFKKRGATPHVVYRNPNSSTSAGNGDVCIWPCEPGTWGSLTKCSDICCSCGPCA